MASNNSFPQRDQSPQQSIPLQDLNRPPDDEEDVTSAQRHRRSLSDRSRNLFRQRDSGSGRARFGARYAPIEESPSRSRPPPTARAPRLVTNDLQPQERQRELETASPLDDVGAFAAAIGGFSGLSFSGEPAYTPPAQSPPSHTSRNGHFNRPSLPRLSTDSSDPYFSTRASESRAYATPIEEDTAPLTSPQNLQPISGAAVGDDQRNRDRSGSFQSVQFLTPAGGTPQRRLGDDLHNAEAGLSPSTPAGRARGNSLSPTGESPLARAGTIMRHMSQRVVNISNESEVVQKSLNRKSSQKPRESVDPQAFLQEPPSFSFPDSTAYSHDGAHSPVEKPMGKETITVIPANPLKGRSLGLFPADSRLRRKLCDLLVSPFTEPLILLLIIIQTVLLAVDSRRDQYNNPEATRFGTSWIDYALLAIFSIYSAEIIVRVIVSGFIINPVEYSTINRQVNFRTAVMKKGKELFALERKQSMKNVGTTFGPVQPSILRALTIAQPAAPNFAGSPKQQQRARLAHRAFLRHSFNRLDFIAVCAYWISFVLTLTSVESSKHLWVFRMLSCLRILRLLLLTSGTTVILRSLKKAAPLLLNVAFLVGFFWLLFAVVGVQSFKASLRRNCVWVDPQGVEQNYTQEFQFCGGHLDAVTGDMMPWVHADGSNGATEHKGYLCPVNSFCVEGTNPYNGTVSFDNIFQSLELVFVVMSSNTWSDIMYYLMDAEYLVAGLFFGAGVLILSFWLISLLVAVITSSFQVIREESKASAFSGEDADPIAEDPDAVTAKKPRNTLKQAFDKTKWVWIAVITLGLIVQSLRSSTMASGRRTFIDVTETVVTIILFIEIIMRFVVDWRHFFYRKLNLVDLGIAIITMVIQLPPVRSAYDGRAYAWLTVFQIMRAYRVVMAIPMTRDLLMVVLGNTTGLINLIIFVFLLTFLGAIFAVQLFRGDLPLQNEDGETIRHNFYTIFNSFLGMYTVLSSENWTSILYDITNYNRIWDSAWIGAAFFIIWFILANFIVLNMFIAVIQENFDVSEDEKRVQQVKQFLQKREMGGAANGNLSLSTIFKLNQHTGRRKDPLDFTNATTEMLLKDAVVRDFLDEQPNEEPTPHLESRPTFKPAMTNVVMSGSLSSLWGRIVGKVKHREPNPFYARIQFSKAQEDLDPREMAKEVVSANERRKKAQREYLRKHPHYNVSLFIFGPDNPIRKICQRIVGPGRGGSRVQGVDPSVPIWYAFSVFIYAAIIAMVVLACVTTPLYQRDYFKEHNFSVQNWFVFTDMGFAILFTSEALIKVIADGFFWTPNAYFRGSWGFIDGVVLITLWINIGASLYNEGQVSRTVGAFKALRALRLLNVSDSARDTFHQLIVRGGWKLVSAAFVSLSLLIPFAIYGLNLFNGRMDLCNDDGSNIFHLTDCVGEYMSSPYGWDVLAPRAVDTPSYSFDDFGDSLFILFQVVSQEGWTDVMWSAQSITGVFTQPRDFSQVGNAVFFVVFNLLGAVFVLTLFVSVFMRNYTEQTGVAFLTTDQRSWLELRKILRQVNPSKRSGTSKKRENWEEWCYRRAVKKSGTWQRFITCVLVVHIILLCTEYYPHVDLWYRLRDYIFLVLTLIYIANIVIRIVGLTWSRFRRSSWDLYSLASVTGTFVTTILLLANVKTESRTYSQIHKFWLVSIALLIIPRNNQLDQLFKTAAACLAAIANLLATWFVLFLVYAIALTQTFGLTRFGEGENGNINFRNVPKALILLFRTSIGEGWNSLMEDYAGIEPPLCTLGERYFDSDCGSPEWARALFISWNILSMYIFVNLFISLIYESFSYVYQRSSGLSVISREEIRRFKQAWAEFDPMGTGYIDKEKFPRFLGELSGVFEMRIYDSEDSVGRIIEDCSEGLRRASALPVDGYEQGLKDLDLEKLNKRISKLPLKEIRLRRMRMNMFYEEVLIGADPDRGIAFNSLLLTLAHYKLIDDSKSLRLDEFLRRRSRLTRVQETVQRNVVKGFFDTVFWRRKFLRIQAAKNSGRMTAIPQLNVPEIFVEDENHNLNSPSPPSRNQPFRSRAGSLHPLDTSVGATAPADSRTSSPTSSHSHSRNNSIQATPISPTMGRGSHGSRGSNPGSPQADWQFASALSRPGSPSNNSYEGRGDARSRANSSVSAQDALDAFDNSAWGESMRRSFTLRRPRGG